MGTNGNALRFTRNVPNTDLHVGIHLYLEVSKKKKNEMRFASGRVCTVIVKRVRYFFIEKKKMVDGFPRIILDDKKVFPTRTDFRWNLLIGYVYPLSSDS